MATMKSMARHFPKVLSTKYFFAYFLFLLSLIPVVWIRSSNKVSFECCFFIHGWIFPQGIWWTKYTFASFRSDYNFFKRKFWLLFFIQLVKNSEKLSSVPLCVPEYWRTFLWEFYQIIVSRLQSKRVRAFLHDNLFLF